jgi:hypothetical protein
VADVLRDLLLETPPNVGGGIHDLFRAWKVGTRLNALPMQAKRDVLDLFTISAANGSSAGSSPSRSRRASASTRGGQLREPVCARHGLRAAAPRVRRGERQEGLVGPRDRRHGRDHAGDAREAEARGVEIRTGQGVASVLDRTGARAASC